MLKRFAVALAVTGIPFSLTLAETPPAAPASAGDCLKIAFELHQAAENRKVSDEEFDKVDALLSAMESQCNAAKYGEAMASAENVRSLLGTGK